MVRSSTRYKVPKGLKETVSTQLNQTDHLSDKLDETANKIVAALIRPRSNINAFTA
jgi:hypothetical protein